MTGLKALLISFRANELQRTLYLCTLPLQTWPRRHRTLCGPACRIGSILMQNVFVWACKNCCTCALLAQGTGTCPRFKFCYELDPRRLAARPASVRGLQSSSIFSPLVTYSSLENFKSVGNNRKPLLPDLERKCFLEHALQWRCVLEDTSIAQGWKACPPSRSGPRVASCDLHRTQTQHVKV